MELSEFKVSELRTAARQISPEARGAGGIGHVGTKEDLIAFLQQKGVMPGEVGEIIAGNKNFMPPQDTAGNALNLAAAEPAAESAGQQEDAANTGEPTPDTGDGKEDGNEEQSGSQQEQEKEEQSQNNADELEIIRKIITKNIKLPEPPAPSVDEEAVEEIVDRKLKAFKKRITKVLEIKKPDGEIKTIGLCHRLTEVIARVCNLGIHQMLVGPAGGGKTTCVEKVAEILGLDFYPMSVGPQTTKSDLLGFIDAAGNYHSTPLRKAFENGGLLLLDEVDAANAGVLTVINSLLANGYCSFPDGIVSKHESFRCICACNTYGRGADRMYVGRNQLDAATLDRFAVLDFDYDEDLERQIAGNDEWVARVQKFRRRAFDLKMRIVISPRASFFGAKLLAAGMELQDVEDLVLWKGIAEDTKNKIMGY